MLFSYALATIVALFVLFVVLSLILMFIGNGAEPDPRAQRPRIITWPDGSVRLPRGQSRYTGVQPTPIPVTTTTSQQCLSQSPYQQQQQQPMHRPQPQPQPQPQGAPVVDPRYSHAYPPVLTPMDAQLAEMEAMREYERMMNPMAVTEDPRPGPTFWELLGDAAWGVICAMRRRARIWLGLRQKVPPPIPKCRIGIAPTLTPLRPQTTTTTTFHQWQTQPQQSSDGFGRCGYTTPGWDSSLRQEETSGAQPYYNYNYFYGQQHQGYAADPAGQNDQHQHPQQQVSFGNINNNNNSWMNTPASPSCSSLYSSSSSGCDWNCTATNTNTTNSSSGSIPRPPQPPPRAPRGWDQWKTDPPVVPIIPRQVPCTPLLPPEKEPRRGEWIKPKQVEVLRQFPPDPPPLESPFLRARREAWLASLPPRRKWVPPRPNSPVPCKFCGDRSGRRPCRCCEPYL